MAVDALAYCITKSVAAMILTVQDIQVLSSMTEDCNEWTIVSVNTLRPGQNGRYFIDDILKSIFLNENIWILTDISLNFVPKGQINNIPALVPIMAWRRRGHKLLSEPMMVSLLTHKCVTRPQWVKEWNMKMFLCFRKLIQQVNPSIAMANLYR